MFCTAISPDLPTVSGDKFLLKNKAMLFVFAQILKQKAKKYA